MKIIIHIGMHKTGSSSIQDTLHTGLKDLDFKYINLITPNHSGQMLQLFSKNLRRNPTFAAIKISNWEMQERKRELEKSIRNQVKLSKYKNFIISGEEITNLLKNELIELKDFFESLFDKIIIVGYIRPPKGYNESAFQQRLKAGLENVNINSIYPYYRIRFEKFDEVFGKENVFLWKFDPKKFPERDVVIDFCTKLGIPIKKDDIFRVNESLSQEAIALLYVYRKYGPELVKGKQAILENDVFLKYFQNVGKTKFKVSFDFISPILEKHKEDVVWMEERLGERLDENFQYNKNSINNEEELENIALNSVNELLRVVDKQYLRKEIDTSSIEGVVEVIHAFKLEVIGRMNKKEENLKTSVKKQIFIKKRVISPLVEKQELNMIKSFDINWEDYYIRNNIDDISGNPIIHYITNWRNQNLIIENIFDTYYYLIRYADIKEADINPLIHYFRHGIKEGREGVEKKWS